MEKNSKLQGKKREREDDDASAEYEQEEVTNHEISSSLENNLTFSDTLIALRIMHAQFPKLEKVSIQPFILRSQLYSSVKDRTQVDRDLESLKKENVLRIFKLNTGQDDHAIMFMEDYFNQIGIVEKRMEGKWKDKIGAFGWFKSHVIVAKPDPSIEHQELCLLLSLGGKVKDDHISLLINAGLLTRQLIDSNMYWFTIPNIGSVLKGLSQIMGITSKHIAATLRVEEEERLRKLDLEFYMTAGSPLSGMRHARINDIWQREQGRKELLSFLKRRKYKEMPLALLEKKRLRMSPLDMRFHLRDLIGSGQLKMLQTPTGLVVQASKD